MGTHPWRPLFPCQNLAGSRRSGWRAHKETCFSVLLSQLLVWDIGTSHGWQVWHIARGRLLVDLRVQNTTGFTNIKNQNENGPRSGALTRE